MPERPDGPSTRDGVRCTHPMHGSHVLRLLPVSLLLACVPVSAAGQPDQSRPAITIPYVDRAPTLEDFLDMRPAPDLDGRMARVSGFTQQRPSDGQPSTQRTDVYLGYDQRHLYVVFVAFDSEPDKVRAQLARRENISDQDDWVEVALDTFGDQRRGYLFDTNPLGVQWDALWSEADGEDASFDAVWESRGQLTDQGYVVWMAIPFKSLRFPAAASQTWGLIFTRWISRVPEKSTWPHVSSRVQGRMNQAGVLTGLANISPGRNAQVIPYGVFRSFRALDELDPDAPEFVTDRADYDGGADAKVVVRDSFVIDLTLNPDFSQVESDEPQVTVNQRFEVFFPEKRPFFIENASFFQTPINLLFTRRIADPQVGVRLTGKLGDYSIGALLADDQAPGKSVLPSNPLADERAWFGVVRVNRDILDQSTVGAIYTHRGFAGGSNRVAGVDSRLKLGRNWVASLQAVASDTTRRDGSSSSGAAYDVGLSRSGRQFEYAFEINDRSPGFRTEPGFVRRVDIRQIQQEVSYRWRPEGRVLVAWGPGADTTAIYDHGGTRLDVSQELSVELEFAGQTRLELVTDWGRERLRPRDFPGLTEARDFSRTGHQVEFASNYYPWLGVGLAATWGTVVNVVPPPGALPAEAGEAGLFLSVTFRPNTQLRIDNRYIVERLRDRATDARLYTNHIARSRWSWQFTRALSARVILDYERVDANPRATRLETTENLNTDFLVTYLVNPWTALYVGYNSNWQNIDIVPTSVGSRLIRTDALVHDTRGLFVKYSHLFRF